MLKVDFGKMLSEIWEYLVEHYLTLDFSRYNNLNISKTATTLSVIVIGLIFGCMLAAFFAVIQKNFGGIPVRRLLESEAHSPRDALTLEEMGLHKNPFVKFALKCFLAVKKTVAAVSIEERDPARLAAEKPKKSDSSDGDAATQFTKEDIENLASETLEKEPNMLFKKKKTRLSALAFYIPEGLRYRALFRFDKKGSSILHAVIAAVVFFLLIFILLYFIPNLLQMMDNIVGSFGE